jgi:enamine deaminase RidA (YjgF/YER057c/UK114 family)
MHSEAVTSSWSAQARFAELGLSFPPAPPRVGNFVSCVLVGDLLFVSGQGSNDHLGKLGVDLDEAQACAAAREAMLRLLRLVQEELGTLDRVRRIVKLLGFVNCEPGFSRSNLVMNGASDLLEQIFGENGRHARSAIGVTGLPHNFAVEIEMIVQVDP